MGRVLLCSCVLFLCFSSLKAQVLLNEVYYDHPGADGGHEFVELFNGAAALALDGWSLETHDGGGGGWSLLWRASPGDSIGPGSLFVIGGASVVPSNARLPASLQNGPDAIRLVRDGVTIDRLGYGELDDPDLFEGTSAQDAPAGSSLARYPDGADSDDNGRDFRVLPPSPGLLNRPVHNVAVTPVAPRRLAVASGAFDDLSVRVTNTGTAVAAGVSVVLADTNGTEYERASVAAMAPGDSADVAFAFASGDGYVRMSVTAVFASDERPGDNAVIFLRRFGGPALLVSEIMSDPPGDCPEYVELFNADAVLYDVTGYGLRDRVSQAVPLTGAGLVVTPRSYVVLTHDAAALARWFPSMPADGVIEVTGTWPSLNHSGSVEADSVVIVDVEGLPVERVAYPPQPADGRARSLERVDLFGGEREHTWVLSEAAEGGTPGRANTREMRDPAGAGGMTVVPNPFELQPGRTLVVTVPGGPARARVQVFDLEGRRVADLGTSDRLPFVFVWDGRDRHGLRVPPGIFIVACEAWQQSGAKRVERVVVGCVEARE